MNIEGLEVNSPEYWEIRHQRDTWPRWSSWAMNVVFTRIPKGADVLVVACGQGMEAIKLREHRPDLGRILGFDVSPTAIQKAREVNPYDDVEFEVLDVFKLHEEKLQFDYGVSIQNLEHWHPKVHRKAASNMMKSICPGGRFFITGVGRAWDLSQMNYSPMEYDGKVIDTPNDYHYCNWSEQDIYDLFTNLDNSLNASSVNFWRLRRKNRVVAEVRRNDCSE